MAIQIRNSQPQEYEAEGIDWTKIEFIDNQDCVDAIESNNPRYIYVYIYIYIYFTRRNVT